MLVFKCNPFPPVIIFPNSYNLHEKYCYLIFQHDHSWNGDFVPNHMKKEILKNYLKTYHRFWSVWNNSHRNFFEKKIRISVVMCWIWYFKVSITHPISVPAIPLSWSYVQFFLIIYYGIQKFIQRALRSE